MQHHHTQEEEELQLEHSPGASKLHLFWMYYFKKATILLICFGILRNFQNGLYWTGVYADLQSRQKKASGNGQVNKDFS